MGLASDRAVLIRYTVGAQRSVGSGLRMCGRFVLTADHCATGADYRVEFLDGSSFAAAVHQRSGTPEVDLAVLVLEDAAPPVDGLAPARVDRSVAESITGCQVLGFPRWRRGDSDARILAQLDGSIPVAEGLRASGDPGAAGLLEFKGTGPALRETPTSTGEPAQASPWGGVSGAAVVRSDRVLGVVRSHNLAAGGMSLTLTPLAAVADLPGPVADRFVTALGLPADVADWEVLPDPVADLSRTVLRVVDPAGHPPRVGDVDAGRFGVRRARTDIDLLGDDYYAYVPRDVDGRLAAALDQRVRGSDTRMLLLVGEAMTGKSRTGAQALQGHPVLRDLPLLVPARGPGLDRVADIAQRLVATAGGAVLWLDDLNDYYPWLSESVALRWRATEGLVVVATVRRDQLATLQDDAGVRATWEFVTDDDQVEQVDLPVDWSDAEQGRLSDAPGWVRARVAAGTPLGEVLGAAQELLRRLRTCDPRTRGLVDLVVDWRRTGVPEPLSPERARALWPAYLPRRDAATLTRSPGGPAALEQFAVARRDACTPIPGTTAALLTLTGDGMLVEDLLLTTRTRDAEPIPRPVWEAALEVGLWNRDDRPELLPLLGFNTATAGEYELARRAWEPAAQAGHTRSQYNLGVLLATLIEPSDLVAARRWFTTAAEAGDTRSQYNLGVLLVTRLDPPDVGEARRWFTDAAGAGHIGAQYNLAMLLATRLDPPEVGEARRWFTAAAEAGHTHAQYNLGVLLAELDPPELAEARRWFTAAAEAGYTPAQYNLGVLLSDLVDPPEVAEARRWYTLAAEAGDADARANLALLAPPTGS